MNDTFRIGFIGAGPVTQAIHLPALSTLGERWQIAKVMDVDADVATKVASRCAAIATTHAASIIADDDIDVVAICSPNAFHAEQTIACCKAGKRAVLCEKPLAITREEAAAVAEAAAESGTRVMVGTMHAYDPGFRAGLAEWTQQRQRVTHVKSSIFLPPNAAFVGLATESLTPGGPPPVAPGQPSPEQQRAALKQTILGLAIHHIPLVRTFFPQCGKVLSARRLPPLGYSLLMHDGERSAELLGFMPGQWPTSWTFEVSGAGGELAIEFPPSYVLAGSGRATVRNPDSSRTFEFEINGYQAQWLQLHEALCARKPLSIPLSSAIDDLLFALELADRAAAVMEIEQ
ncbi:Gfo/Idh/MocA family protein [Steroidobacter flavus]|uniref:Gfo/Idh/MocA family protein n=1 Tax=Steroidobacter flavus TaxID=1842136 RepID=A0ABV8SWR7_9GAMM